METRWKYGMIKVAEEFDLETNEFLDDICELVELYEDIEGNWSSFCRPSLTSPENLSVAMVEVMKDGINTWFWENGTFRWSMENRFWEWTPATN